MNAATNGSGTLRPMTPEEVGLVVRLHREAMGWSQETLCELSGLNTRTIQRIEAGQASSPDSRRAIAREFQIADLDVFTKPMPFPPAEELQERRAAFERECIVLEAQLMDGRKLVTLLTELPAFGAIGAGSMADLPRAAQDAFAAVLDYARDCMDVADEASWTEVLGYGDELEGLIGKLRAVGYHLCAAQRSTKVTNKAWADPTPLTLDIIYLAVARADQPRSKLVVSRKFGPIAG